jgi:hypothetical protein
MMGVEDTNTNMPGWFQMRMPAIKRVFDSMTTAEKQFFTQSRRG